MNERWKPSVTVAAVMERDGRYLLVEEDTPEGRRLNTPAGHLEPGEAPHDGAAREALEETAHLFRPTGLVGIYMAATLNADGVTTTWMRLAYRGETGPVVPGRRLDAGIVRAIWMTPQEVRATCDHHRSPLVLQCMEDHLAGLSHPLSLVHMHPSAFASARRSTEI